MIHMATESYAQGVYVKGDQTRVANTKADAVQAVFDGFAPVKSNSEDSSASKGGSEDSSASYRDLQAQAKELDIPANQSAEALEQAISDALSDES